MSRPLASLSSGLLARPGSAKPAMRPQAFGYAPVEDLGWNDMGQSAAAPPAPTPPAPVPPVLAERAALTRAVAAPRPVDVSAPAHRKAAFTLRLDAERHLRLRLAGAVSGRSQQQIVMEALDAFLDAQPQIEARVPKVPATAFSGEK